MLRGIDPLLSPDLLHALAAMGHGDEICLADANFPAATTAGTRPLIRLPGVLGTRALSAILSVLPLDDFVASPAARMEVVDDPKSVPPIIAEYQAILDRAAGKAVTIEPVERFAFYERAQKAFAMVATGEGRIYANLLLRKGVIAP